MRVFALMCLVSVFLSAQEDMDFFNLSLEELNDIAVVSASRREEPLREVPVPVTVVTAEMIRKSGARHLADVLTLFVPGMTLSQDHNEVNVAMRGVYGSSQQKFLILVEGHRLNTRAFSQANPDYGISLERVKQIEVLRGPGSSLYGNVALTAVVNIILFKGAEIDGLELVAGAGSYGRRKASMLYGATRGNTDMLIWGSFFRAAGETVYVPPERDFVSADPQGGEAILDRFDEPPSYDVGFRLIGRRWQLFGNLHSGKYAPPFTSGGPTGQIYNYHDYPTVDGVALGVTSRAYHLGAKTRYELSPECRLALHLYTDGSKIVGGLVTDPATRSFGYPEWYDKDYGTQVQIERDFKLLGRRGEVTAGVHLDFMEQTDSRLLVGTQGAFLPVELPLMDSGHEAIYSGFVQMKQSLSARWLVNAGFRYDYKERGAADSVSNLAPRAALVFLQNDLFDWKLSYASSFVDAPYWYRYNRLPSYRGGADLKPEYLDALQITGTARWGEDRHKLELNLFHNKLTDFVFRDNAVPVDDMTRPIYKNAGELESEGAELSYRYHAVRLRLNGNITWQHALEAQDYGEQDGDIFNVPSVAATLVSDIKLPAGIGRNSWLNLTVRRLGSQRSPIVVPQLDLDMADYRVDAVTLVNTGVYLEKSGQTGISLDLRVTNLFDETWYQGGSVQFPYPQPGRWYSVNLGFAF